MTFFEAFKSKLLTDATIISLGPITRCYPQAIPEKPVYPFAVVRRVSGGEAIVSHDGDDGLNPVRVELTVYDTDVSRMEKLISRSRVMFKGFNGLLGGAGGVRFSCGKFAGPRSVYHAETRSQGMQLDILGLLDESTIA